MSQMPLLSSSLRLMGMDGRKCPSKPVVQSAGISQIRKKPSTWSIRYAWKYLPITNISQSLLQHRPHAQGFCDPCWTAVTSVQVEVSTMTSSYVGCVTWHENGAFFDLRSSPSQLCCRRSKRNRAL